MNPSTHRTHKGILKAEAGMQKFSLSRYEPSADLAAYIELYWVVRWDLRGQAPYRQTILSYPNVNLSFERELGGTFTGVYGVPHSTYTRLLQDEGAVLGIKFRPGGFYPFWRKPVSQLSGQTVPFREIFGFDVTAWEDRILAEPDGAAMASHADELLRSLQPEPDDQFERINHIVQTVVDNREIVRVEDLSQRFDVNVRMLQRLFSRYVGVSPKWVIQRFRLQEAAELMEKGAALDWAKLSLELGYYDQAHFIRDFKAVIGKSPEAYVASPQL